MKRYLIVPTLICAVALIQGCATPSTGVNMVASLERPATGPRDASLHRAITVRKVTGGSETNPMWVSKVSDDDFRSALESSLKFAQLLGVAKPLLRYQLDAALLSLDQPLMGLDITVTCSAQYDLTETASGRRVFSKTITTPFTATLKDAFLAMERLRIANEGAVRQNLRQLLEELLTLDVDKSAPSSGRK